MIHVGASYVKGDAAFDSRVEVAQMLDNRQRPGPAFLPTNFAQRGQRKYDLEPLCGQYARSHDRLALTLAGRYDSPRITLADRSGQSRNSMAAQLRPVQSAAGLTFRVNPALVLYGTFHSRAARDGVDNGLRRRGGTLQPPMPFWPIRHSMRSWRGTQSWVRASRRGRPRVAGQPLRDAKPHDILFQTVGGPQANVGFFDNVADTQRTGFELSLSQTHGRLHWSVDYSLVDATFEDDFVVNSPNHPEPPAALVAGDDKLRVASGSTIPGIARHQANLGLDLAVK